MRRVVITPAEEGGYWASIPSLPGCFSQGETWEETLANIQEAIELFVESLIAHGACTRRQPEPGADDGRGDGTRQFPCDDPDRSTILLDSLYIISMA